MMCDSWSDSGRTTGLNRPDYVLGHSDHELGRLGRQAELLDPITREFLAAAGLAPGMRVLDVGSGAGAVAFVAAQLVAPGGRVIGTDTAPAAVATASFNASVRGVASEVEFRDGDPAELTFEEPFDAVVGRYVLLFQPDPAAMVRRLVRHLVPGGLVVFHEPDWYTVRSSPPAPTYDRCCRWIVETTDRAGTPLNMAGRLHHTFVDAGLPPPTMTLRTSIGSGEVVTGWLHAVADIVETLLPAMEVKGVATVAEVDLETLRERLIREVSDHDATIIGRSEVGAWCHVGGDS
jgi:SAM-dependent methyltransferase